MNEYILFVRGKYITEEKNQDKRWRLIHSIQNCVCIYTDPLNSMFQFIETFSWIALTMVCHNSVRSIIRFHLPFVSLLY